MSLETFNHNFDMDIYTEVWEWIEDGEEHYRTERRKWHI